MTHHPADLEPADDVVRSRLAITADALAVRRLPGWLTELLASTGPDAATLQPRLELAVHEVCMNVIDHAYGPQHVSRPDDLIIDGELHPDVIRIQVRDRGVEFDRRSVVKPVSGVPQLRGYGLVIVEKLADEVDYTRADGTNIFSLRFDRVTNAQGTPS